MHDKVICSGANVFMDNILDIAKEGAGEGRS